MQTQKIEISYRTILFTVFLLIFLWFVYFIRDIIFFFFVSLLLMTILNPFVNKLSKLKMPRAISVFTIYVVVIGVLVFVFSSLLPIIIDQTLKLVGIFPSFIENVGFLPVVGESLTAELTRYFAGLSEVVVRFTFSAFSSIMSLIAVLVLAFYLLLEQDKSDRFIQNIFGKDWSKRVRLFLDLWEKEIGGWLRGQLLLMFSVGLSTLVGLLFLRIPFALPLALLAGIFEIVPVIGPLIAAVPAIIIGVNVSYLTGLFVVVLYILVQQLENYLLAPKIMQKSTGISPVTIIVSLAVGTKLAGFWGALLAIPVFLTIRMFLRVFLLR